MPETAGVILKADDAVRLIAARGQHQHRHIAAFADFLEHFKAVEFRQHDVENQRAEVLSDGAFNALGTGMREFHLVAEGG